MKADPKANRRKKGRCMCRDQVVHETAPRFMTCSRKSAKAKQHNHNDIIVVVILSTKHLHDPNTRTKLKTKAMQVNVLAVMSFKCKNKTPNTLGE